MSLLSIFYLSIISVLGIAITRVLPFRFPSIIKIIVGPAVGIIFHTQIMLLLSLLLGFTPGTVVLSLTLLVLMSLILFFLRHPDPVEGLGITGLKNHVPGIIVCLGFTLFAIYIFSTKVLTPTSYGLITGTGGLWADTAMHSAYTMSLVEQSASSLTPQNPLFAGQALIYPFLVNFFSASLVLLGSNLRFAFILPQIVYFTAFISLFYFIVQALTNKKAAVLTLFIFFLGWGLGFGKYIEEVRATGQLMPFNEYTNNHGIYNMHNVLTGMIFPERSMLPGLVIGLLITSFFLRKSHNVIASVAKQSIYQSILIGLLLGILPLWHTHTFIFFGAAVGIWSLSWLFPPLSKGRMKVGWLQLFITYFIAGLLALPVILWFTTQVSHESFIHLTSGWIQAKDNFVRFWILNTGLVIPLALFAWVKSKTTKLFFLPAFFFFLFANIVMFSPWDWDNIKLFTWVFLFLSILAGDALSFLSNPFAKGKQIPPLSKGVRQLAEGGVALLLSKICAFLIFFSLIFSGFLSNVHLTQVTHTIYDNQDMGLAEWVLSSTKPSDIFLIDPWVNHPLLGLTGRSAYLGYPGQLWVHGIEYGKREQLARDVLAGKTDVLKSVEVPINYIVVPTPTKILFEAKNELELVYENPKFTVYQYLP